LNAWIRTLYLVALVALAAASVALDPSGLHGD
jgi:hypothetical protein